jgi:hypothetical protein
MLAKSMWHDVVYPWADGGEVDHVLIGDLGDEPVRRRGARERLRHGEVGQRGEREHGRRARQRRAHHPRRHRRARRHVLLHVLLLLHRAQHTHTLLSCSLIRPNISSPRLQ